MTKRLSWVIAALLAGGQALLLSECRASDCDGSPRNIGAFGAEGTPAPKIVLDATLRSQLADLHEVRRIIDTQLARDGEKVVIYDSDSNDYDPHPRVAIAVDGQVVKTFDESALNRHGGGFERYLGSCEFNLTRGRRALAVVVSAGGDGAASVFAIIAWQSGRYRIIFDPMVAQGRMELAPAQVHLWNSVWGKVSKRQMEAGGDFECVWCPHRYSVTEYLWRNGRFIKAKSTRTKRRYDPSEITGVPLVLR